MNQAIQIAATPSSQCTEISPMIPASVNQICARAKT